MRKTIIIFFFFLLLFTFPSITKKVEAATLKFSPSATTVNPGEQFEVRIVIDTVGEKIIGFKAEIDYVQGAIIVDDVIISSRFSEANYKNKSPKIIAQGNTPLGSYETGAITLATLKLKAFNPTTLTFNCPQSNANKYSVNAENILTNCTNLQITVGAGGPTSPPNTFASIFPLAGKIGTINSITNLLLPILMILALLVFLAMLLWSAFTWLTAGSNPENLNKARKIATYAIIGLAVVLTSYVAVKLMAVILNIQLPI